MGPEGLSDMIPLSEIQVRGAVAGRGAAASSQGGLRWGAGEARTEDWAGQLALSTESLAQPSAQPSSPQVPGPLPAALTSAGGEGTEAKGSLLC